MNQTFKKYITWIMASIGIGIFVSIISVGIYIGYFVSQFDSSSLEDLSENYISKNIDINEIKTYINSITPANKFVHIEFEDDDNISIFHVTSGSIRDQNWDLNISSSKVDTLLNKLNWTRETLSVIKNKLDVANCISVSNGNPCNIGYQRSGMGMYFYNIFSSNIPDSLISSYNDSCTYVLFNKKVVFEFGGGAIGPQCFPEFK